MLPTWPAGVKSAILHVISLAQFATAHTRSWAANSLNARVRLKAENGRLQEEVRLLCEEIRIKDARMARSLRTAGPHYPPTERMAILELKAARGWSLEQTAKTFLVTAATIASWMKRLDEDRPGRPGATAATGEQVPGSWFATSSSGSRRSARRWAR